jgi:prophage tail gpP-like protein
LFTTRHKPDDVGLILDGQEFRYWQELELVDSLDEFSTLAFKAPFEASRKEFRDTFRPFTYQPVKVTLGGQQMFTGTLIGVHPNANASSSWVDVNGYALCGVLDDCNAPSDSLPHEYRKIGFAALAAKLLKPFDITIQVRGDEGAKFAKVKLNIGDKVGPFLSELARQRSLVTTNTPDGMVLCWQSVKPGNPVARLNGQESPVTTVSASFSPQDYFSDISAFSRSRRGRKGAKYTAQNPYLKDVKRPHTFFLEDTEKADAPEAAKAKLGRMFANMASFTVDDLPTWRDPDGNVWTPNTTVLLTAPNAMVYRETEMLIRKVTLRQSGEKKTASLELCLLGCFSAEVPPFLPWNE